uniref:Vitelline coat protein 42 n=1 Tax=Tegula pfeifferi TaxID=81901 RepID=Q9GV39_TEGPF|nr:vitelline coat protein 42 [Omphalius pfeifferi]
MATLSTAIVIFALAAAAVAEIPENYTLKVTPYCGKGAEADARIEIVTDLVIKARLECAGGVNVDFTTTDKVNYVAYVSYPTHSTPHPCVFLKKVNAMVFSVKVLASYGEGPRDLDCPDPDPEGSGDPDVPGLVRMEEGQWTVTCSFGLMGNGKVGKNVIEGCIAPTELMTNAGPASSSSFDLELVDVTGRSLAGQDVHNGRTVQLRGVATSASGVIGIRPVSCFAIDGVAAYAILRAGCGDGIVFPKDRGFITNGLTTLSPYFMAFEINFASTVTYKCHFVTCDENCDGSSCPVERGRRSTSDCRQTDCGAFRSKSLEAPTILSRLLRRR